MVAALGPGKFYGSSLPRPRFYKLNDHRVDPPPPVTDPLVSWAEEAHWSMGGLSFKRHRLQGRIEGDVERLRAQRELICEKPPEQQKPVEAAEKQAETPSQTLVEEDARPTKRGAVRKLGNVFEKVAMDCSSGGESGGAVAARTPGKRPVKGTRSSPRLLKSSGLT